MSQGANPVLPEDLGPSAEEVFNEYFKKSQSVIGTLNPNIFWQLHSEANPPAEDSGEVSPLVPSKDDPSPAQ